MGKKKRKDNNKCNICGLPGVIVYQEMDEHTGRVEKKSHTVGCLGHQGIHPSLWNKHPDFHKYHKYTK